MKNFDISKKNINETTYHWSSANANLAKAVYENPEATDNQAQMNFGQTNF